MNLIAKELLKEFTPDNLWINSKWSTIAYLSTQQKGLFGEMWVERELTSKGYKAEVVKEAVDYDVLVNDNITVEVKFAMAKKGQLEDKVLTIDYIQWQGLDILRSDIYAFVGVNPEVGYRFRAGWRQEVEDSFILYFTSEQLQAFKESGGLLNNQGKRLLITSKAFLKRLDYAQEYRDFPL